MSVSIGKGTTALLADGRMLVARVEHPRGSPHRRMGWGGLRALFQDTVAEALPAEAVAEVVDLVAGLDGGSPPQRITATLAADPDWLARDI